MQLKGHWPDGDLFVTVKETIFFLFGWEKLIYVKLMVADTGMVGWTCKQVVHMSCDSLVMLWRQMYKSQLQGCSVDKISYGGTYFWALRMEFASCHPCGT